MMLKILNVGNGNNKYPGNFTKKEKKIIKYNCKGRVLNLFAGLSSIGTDKVDFNNGNIKMDVFEFLKKNKIYYNTILLDAPFNDKFANIYKKLGNTPDQFIIFAMNRKTTELFNYIKKMNPERIIIKSWNYYIPEGYKLNKGYLCYAGGYRKPTILLIIDLSLIHI